VALPDVGRTNTPVNPTRITEPVLGARSIVINSGAAPADEHTPVAPRQSSDAPVAPRQSADASIKPSSSAATGNGLGLGAVAQTGGGSVRVAREPEPRVGGADSAPLYKRIDLVYVEDGDSEGKGR
jgi:hypothetical protein